MTVRRTTSNLLVVITIAGALVTGLLAPLGPFGSLRPGGPTLDHAEARTRPDCTDGPGNAWDQVKGEIIGTFFPAGTPNPYDPESLNGIWSRCYNPNRPPPAGYRPNENYGIGSTWGDPHIVTQDGAAYDFHGAGDFVALTSPEFDTEIQVRYERLGSVSVLRGVAIRRADSTLAILQQPIGQPMEITLDGEPLTADGTGWHDTDLGRLLYTDDVIFVEVDDGLALEMRRGHLRLATPNEWDGKFSGIQGDGDRDPANDVATRDGTTIDPTDSDALYGPFFDSWYVDPADSMFPVPFDDDRYGPARPDDLVTLADLDPADVEAALATCRGEGVPAGAGLEACVFDVAVTGDDRWAVDAGQIHPQATVAVASLDPLVLDRITLSDVGVVAPGEPDTGAGRLEEREGADVFDVPEADDVRSLRVNEPCGSDLAAVAVVSVDGRALNSHRLTCGAVYPLPSEAFTLTVHDTSGLNTEYAFTIAGIERTDLGALADGNSASGELAAEAVASAELEFAAGSNIYLAPLGVFGCAIRTVVTDGQGTELATSQRGCAGLGPIELRGPAPYSVELRAASDAEFEFQVTEVADDATTAAEFGAEVALEVRTAGSVVSATYELTRGERFYVESVEWIDGTLRVIGPDGEERVRTFSASDPGVVEADASGRYRVEIHPNGPTTGTQRFVVHRTADDVEVTAEVGDDVELPVESAGQLATASIRLSAGERIEITNLETTPGANTVTIYDPSGERLGGRLASFDIGIVEAPVDGTYRLVFAPQGAAVGTQVVSIRPV